MTAGRWSLSCRVTLPESLVMFIFDEQTRDYYSLKKMVVRKENLAFNDPGTTRFIRLKTTPLQKAQIPLEQY